MNLRLPFIAFSRSPEQQNPHEPCSSTYEPPWAPIGMDGSIQCGCGWCRWEDRIRSATNLGDGA